MGTADAMSTVWSKYPEKKVYFTEQWISAQDDFMGALRWHTKNIVIGALRNWSRTVLEWNLASDPAFALHTPKGAVGAMGGVTIGPTITRNPGYYLMAHSAKFIRPGAVRIQSSEPEQLPNVTCRTPDGRMVMMVMNDSDGAKRFRIQHRGTHATLELGAGEVATFRWAVDAAVA
jgi:glucosylceramidase